ncbi:MAG TPA: ABC transporter ATP-binding protein [Hypericibacter adhaerens]|jgi:peptide/nickel transport system ATP-binding protein|uniref:ABC transporter ATP-binding protein n=1 Tax=Hypericibacter adhaerens TaxID=2602016 RepID=UPI002B6CECCF|nr:ABC transporter ATP-binding protein [Hypericibacter adhaerens]HWA42462.1 ABC transporter ATP-binding protein [Hypericibacter adhaerens]
MTAALIEAQDLTVEIETRGNRLRPVDRVSFVLRAGEVMGLVGESGSGKSMTCRALMRLLPGRQARIAGGKVLFEGRDIAGLPEAQMRALRGPQMAMIFQNPSSHLDPVMTIGEQIAEAIRSHEPMSRKAARAQAAELLRQVGFPDPARQLDAYAHQFSGGMRQRAMIAAALACRPKLLIADEPTTALDVTVQAQILRLLLDLRDRTGLAIILITHDLGVVAQTCESVAVMYAGRIVERARKADLLRRPLHPYTEALMRSRPEQVPVGRLLPSIEGQPPTLSQLPAGCRFHPRCRHSRPACETTTPTLAAAAGNRVTACLRWEELYAGPAGGRA